MKKFATSLFIILCSFVFISSNLLAQNPPNNDGNFLTNVGKNVASFKDQAETENAEGFIQGQIANIINTVLGWVAIIIVLIVIYAGFLWLTAGGDTDKVKKAKLLIFNATIGAIIIAAAYIITNFIVSLVA